MRNLGPEQPAVTRWLACSEHDLPVSTAWLSAAEAQRAAGLRFTKRRTDHLLRRWVGKQAVAAARGLPTALVDLARIEVANHEGGAPYVLLDGSPLGYDLSLTGRAGWAVCVLGPDPSPVGCDLEVVEPRSAAFVVDYLTTAEQALVAAAPDGRRDLTANLMWAAKESALKVLRTGLRRDTRSVEVVVPTAGSEIAVGDGVHGWAPLEVRTTEGGTLTGWWRADGAFLLTVVGERPLPPPQPLGDRGDLSAAEPLHAWVRGPVTD